MSWAVYRAACILFGSARVASTSAILFNATLMAAVGTMIVTPDAPLLVASSFVLYSRESAGDRARRLVAGRRRCRGCGAGVEIYRAVLRTGDPDLAGGGSETAALADFAWPYFGGIVAVLMFAPVILWNADHHWVSFIKQIGRARIEEFHPAFMAELIPTQFAFATPLVSILGADGTLRLAGAAPARWQRARSSTPCFWTIVAYFVWHSLHARVEANWFAPVYPAFAIAAAVAAHLVQWQSRRQRMVDFCLRWAAPSGAALFVR